MLGMFIFGLLFCPKFGLKRDQIAYHPRPGLEALCRMNEAFRLIQCGGGLVPLPRHRSFGLQPISFGQSIRKDSGGLLLHFGNIYYDVAFGAISPFGDSDSIPNQVQCPVVNGHIPANLIGVIGADHLHANLSDNVPEGTTPCEH
jgi:hypothetical protein